MEKYIERKCKHCREIMKIRIVSKGKNKGKILVVDKNKKFCSMTCLNDWQRIVPWEERVGEESAEKIRKETSERVKGDKNPSKNKDVAKKISESLKNYLEKNPRIGTKNPFYGKNHSEETKNHLSETKKGKWAYDEEGYKKLCENTPKGENHHHWNGGSSIRNYDKKFNKKLKKEIKTDYNNICQICKKENTSLAIHHIDYNKENSLKENLIPLCFSCHGKTNHNRDTWQLFFNDMKILTK